MAAIGVSSGGSSTYEGGSNNYPIRMKNNDLYIFIKNTFEERLEAFKSTDNGASFSLVTFFSYNSSISIPYAHSNCLGPDGTIYVCYYQVRQGFSLASSGIFYVEFDTSTDTFGSANNITGGLIVNTLPSFTITACAISDDITKYLHVAWNYGRSSRGLLTEGAYYTRVDVSGGGGSTFQIFIGSFLTCHHIFIEKTNSSRRPVIIASDLSTATPGSDITIKVLSGNVELATSLSAKNNLATAPKTGGVASKFNFVEDNEGSAWMFYAEGGSDYNLKYMKHTGSSWAANYTYGDITSTAGSDYLFAVGGAFGPGTTRNDKVMIARKSIATTGDVEFFDDYNQNASGLFNSPVTLDTGSQYPAIRWSNYQHYAPHIIDYIYEKSGDIYYDKKHLNLHI